MYSYKWTAAFVISFFLFTSSQAYAADYHLEITPSMLLFKSPTEEQNILIKNLSTEAIDLEPTLYVIKDAGNKDGSLTIENPSQAEPDIQQYITLRENGNTISSLHLNPLESSLVSVFYHPVNNSDNNFFTLVFNKKITDSEVNNKNSFSQVVPGSGVIILPTSSDNSKVTLPQISFTTKKFKTSGPIEFKAGINNQTDGIEIITPMISIYNILGQKVGEINIAKQYLLPQSERILQKDGNSLTWNDSLILGPYTARLDIKSGDTTVTKTISFFVIPVFPVLIISFIIFFCLGVYVKARK
jgi:hypothetical protein